MSRTAGIPDAWDDDWEEQIDVRHSHIEEPIPKWQQDVKPLLIQECSQNTNTEPPTLPPAPQQEPEKKISSRAKKAQLRAQHAEFNRQLWAEAEAEAESTQMSHYLETRSTIPLKSEYKPAVKVLSRNPQDSSGLGATTAGLHRITISPRPTGSSNNNDENSSDEEAKKQKQLTPEERLAIAQREREEKQRKYEEVRERLFGSSNTGSGASSPGNTTPPRHQQQGGEHKWKGKARSNGNSRDRGEKREPSSRAVKGKQLYDPNYVAKPNANPGKKKEQRSHNVAEESRPPQAPIRSPRGPDGSGPGGFGFAERGGGTAPR
ncbi:predicted protein [Uncinocarpus reesii 1704]|uniref:Uncharacterized protein n=1 Tax=Uncinocarpus reesii (strain UAMH 1704) TaxID=336963 RepID=C4JS93_UNCRE|nr:uncharacterized protein UREG_05332 [Uncinocarpus reesii 1704]EEP80490.1 predicted protein [Uncinocarpus reesii 1704]